MTSSANEADSESLTTKVSHARPAYTAPSARTLFVAALLSGLAAIGIVILRLGLWNFDLHVPLNYNGDALYEATLVQALTEGAWNFHIARLGAPFGMDAVDFPIACFLDQSVIKLLSIFVSDPALLINVFWLVVIGMAGAFATLFIQSFRLRPSLSAVFGVLYAIIPFTFYRNIVHLNLVHFIVPAGVYLGISLARGEGLPSFGRFLGRTNAAGSRKNFFLRLGLCAAVGLTYIYWAFFTGIALALGCVIGFTRTRDTSVIWAALIYLIAIGVFVIGDLSPTLSYWAKTGTNQTLDYKLPVEADIYGLRIRQMFTPILGHPVPIMQTLRRKIFAAKFPFDSNESSMAALGTVGAIGFTLLFLTALAPASRGLLDDQRLRLLGAFIVGIVFIAEAGGFGSLFNILVIHEFRAYNRISPFISLLSYCGLAVALDGFWSRRGAIFKSLAVVGLLAFAAFDQIPVSFFAGHKVMEQRFHQDRSFIRELESRLPQGAMIFQLPYTGFPIDHTPHQLAPYDHARAYLHSRTLRWSWGAMDGRHGDWAKETSALPTATFLRRIAAAGFAGLLLDRAGFSDPAAEIKELAAHGAVIGLDSGRRWLYLDVQKLGASIMDGRSPVEREKLQDSAIHPLAVQWLPSFSTEEHSADALWHWCGRSGTLRFLNEGQADRTINFNTALQGGAGIVTYDRGGQARTISISGSLSFLEDSFVVKAHSHVDLNFHFAGSLVDAPGDSRELAFCLKNFSWPQPGQSSDSF